MVRRLSVGMSHKGKDTRIYHITDIDNLANILAADGLLSDAQMIKQAEHTVIGHNHIKQRRLEQITVPHSGRFVGDYVPFYYCPRSVMLYSINEGCTGREKGCQKTVLHLVSTIEHAMSETDDWAISDGNAGAFYTSYFHDLAALDDLNWKSIKEKCWQNVKDEKASEFLVPDRFSWSNIIGIACYDEGTAARVRVILRQHQYQPVVKVLREWYY